MDAPNPHNPYTPSAKGVEGTHTTTKNIYTLVMPATACTVKYTFQDLEQVYLQTENILSLKRTLQFVQTTSLIPQYVYISNCQHQIFYNLI